MRFKLNQLDHVKQKRTYVGTQTANENYDSFIMTNKIYLFLILSFLITEIFEIIKKTVEIIKKKVK